MVVDQADGFSRVLPRGAVPGRAGPEAAAEVAGLRLESVCLPCDGGDALVMLHRPDPARARGTAVLLCPAFGWQEACAYRGLRAWAQALAQAGYPAARLTLPSTGDSAGTASDPGRLQAWVDATAAAAAWLRAATGSSRVAAIGLELGGVVACRAQATGAEIDDLVLWGVRARGSALVHELRMFGQIVAGLYPEDARDDDDDSDLRLIGYTLSANTVSELRAVDLRESSGPAVAGRRVLTLGRDGVAFDAKLRRHFEQRGARVENDDGEGYQRLMAEPQDSQKPWATIAKTVDWLDRGPDTGLRPAESTPSGHLRCTYDGTEVQESPLWLRAERGRIFGMLSEPAAGPRAAGCVLLLNAGGIPRAGPSRGWVDLSRRWAARGVPCLRLDLPGIGDSDGADEPALLDTAHLHAPWRARELRLVLDQLQERGVAEYFILGGACSGASIALTAGLADQRVRGLLLVNLAAFAWSHELVAERLLRNAMTGALDRALPRFLRRLPVDQSRLAQATRQTGPDRVSGLRAHRNLLPLAARQSRPDRAWSLLSRSCERQERAEGLSALDRLRDRHVETMFFLSRDEPMLQQLERQKLIDKLDRWPNVTLTRGGSRDHMYRAGWAQREVDIALDAAIERTLSRQKLPA